MRKVLSGEQGLWAWSHFDRIPSALFGNEVRTRCTIALLSRAALSKSLKATGTALLRWNSEFRDFLFSTLNFSVIHCEISAGIPKISSQLQSDVLNALLNEKHPLGADLVSSIAFDELLAAAPDFPQPCVYIGGTAYNWFPVWRNIPETTTVSGKASLPARTAGFRFKSEDQANIVFALLCSSIGYWWWSVASDGFNLKKWLLDRFPISISMIPINSRKELAGLGEKLRLELKKHYVYKDNKGRIGNYFLPACEREVMAIDDFLAKTVPFLSREFLEDIRNFNACFSRINTDDDLVDDD